MRPRNSRHVTRDARRDQSVFWSVASRVSRPASRTLNSVASRITRHASREGGLRRNFFTSRVSCLVSRLLPVTSHYSPFTCQRLCNG